MPAIDRKTDVNLWLKDAALATSFSELYVQTHIVNFDGLITLEEPGKGYTARIEGLNLKNTGSFWHSNGEKLPS